MLISHAQNMEDVLLWRALRHVTPGFYIDIGAHDPVVDSVSLMFHQQGWRGIHVEPVAALAAKLRSARPGDEVVQAAVGNACPSMEFFEVSGTGLSTGRPDIAEQHRTAGYATCTFQTPCLPLSEVLAFSRGCDVHWLKIDVEGMEADVIRSWGPAVVRPWIVVIEAIAPRGQGPAFAHWEPVLEKLGYTFVYFDGVNRFYVSDAHPELKAAFGPGPNILDNFALSGRATSPFCSHMRQELVAARHELLTVRHDLISAQGELEVARQELAATQKDLAVAQQELAESLENAQVARDALRESRSAVERSKQDRDALADELRKAEARISDLNDLSHRLWVLADSYGRELETYRTPGLIRLAKWMAGRALAGLRRRPRFKRGLAFALDLVPAVKRRLLALGAPPARDVRQPRPVQRLSRRAVARVLEILLVRVRRHPALKERLRRALGAFPGLQRRLISFGAARPPERMERTALQRSEPAFGGPPPRRQFLPPSDTSGITASARRAYGQLSVLRSFSAIGIAGIDRS